MSRKRSGKPGWQQEIAEERMRLLFREAGKSFGSHPDRSDRYVELARKIGMRYNVPVPKELRQRFCRGCGSFLVPGSNATARANKKTSSMEIKCHGCGKIARFPYAKEKTIKRRRANNKG